MQKYSLETPVKEDYDFLKMVHDLTLREHIEKIWGWEESAQKEFFQKEFDSGQIKVIHAFGQSIGYLNLYRHGQTLTVVNFLILPQFQRRGLGSKILRDLLKEAKDSGDLVRLGVFKVNHSAKKLYETLGFKTDSETDTHFLMSI